MATVTVDGHSLSINGKRVWIVSGTVHYARIPRALWRSRLLAARQAGLNTIEAPVVWSAHEPREGHFTFEDDLDLPHFLRLIGDLNMHAILRVGPYVGDGYDLGGLPPWLVPAVDRRVRGANPQFLQACSKFIAKLAAQIADFQVTRRPRKGADGPVVMIHPEHEWFCAHDATAQAYLVEIDRYLRENNINVPLINTNNLYQSVEGEIDAWSGFTHLHAIARQLRVIRPSHPRFILSLHVGAPDVWGEPRRSEKSPAAIASALAQVLAAGAQFNVAPFVGGAAPAFSGARAEGAVDRFLTTNRDDSGPITHTGARSPIYGAIKRVATFASSFDRLLTGLDPDEHHITVAPDAVNPRILDEQTGKSEPKRDPAGPNLAVIHAGGSQGSVAFLFADPGASAPTRTTLILTDGSTLPVEVPADHGVAWVLRDTHLIARSTLDYSNLSAFTLAGRIFVCFGPPGATGLISINSSPFEITVPTGKRPAVEEHEDMIVVVCSTEQIDATYATRETVHVGVAGLDESGNPIAHPDFKQFVAIDQTGEAKVGTAPAPSQGTGKPAITKWLTAGEEDNVRGTNVRYARIAGPESMESLGAPSGYAWIRLNLKNASTKKARAAMFEAADRLHVYDDGKLLDVFGSAPGANNDSIITLPLTRGEQTLSILVDNLGRYDAGNDLGHPKGLYGHIYDVKNIKAGAPKLVDADLLDPLAFRAPIFGLRFGEVTDAARLTWTIQHRRKTPILVSVEPKQPLTDLAILLLNDEPIHLISPGHALRAVFDNEKLRRGNNTFQLAVVGDMSEHADNLKAGTSFYEGAGTITEKAEWAFAKWEPPADGAFQEVAKSQLAGRPGASFKGMPRWWKASFTVPHTDRPLLLDCNGLSKGQIFLNGKNLGRYFVGTRANKSVPPQSLYALPEPYLNAGGDNTLLIFDEHGFPPAKVKLTYE